MQGVNIEGRRYLNIGEGLWERRRWESTFVQLKVIMEV